MAVSRRLAMGLGLTSCIGALALWDIFGPQPAHDESEDAEPIDELPDASQQSPAASTHHDDVPDIVVTWSATSDNPGSTITAARLSPTQSQWTTEKPLWSTPTDISFVAGALTLNGNMWGSWAEGESRVIGLATPDTLKPAKFTWENGEIPSGAPNGQMALKGTTLVWIVDDPENSDWHVATWDTSGTTPARIIYSASQHTITAKSMLVWTLRPVISDSWVIIEDHSPTPRWYVMVSLTSDAKIVRSTLSLPEEVVSSVPISDVNQSGSTPWGPSVVLPAASNEQGDFPPGSFTIATVAAPEKDPRLKGKATTQCVVTTPDHSPVTAISFGAGCDSAIVSVVGSSPRWNAALLLGSDRHTQLITGLQPCDVITSSAPRKAAILRELTFLTYLSPDGQILRSAWGSEEQADFYAAGEDVLIGPSGHVALRPHESGVDSWNILPPPVPAMNAEPTATPTA